MPKLVFYRQLRRDGGLRTGIEVDGEDVYGLFEEGETEDDPRLLWFVDLRCEGPKLPRTPKGARKWLLDNTDVIREGFLLCAEETRPGIDQDIHVFTWDKIKNTPADTRMKIVTDFVRRDDSIKVAEILREIGLNWDHLIRALRPVQSTHR